MAVDAALVVDDRPMDPRFVEGIGHLFIVAPLAKLEAGVLERER